MYGKDYTYAQSRIQETIVRIAKTGEPVYVLRVELTGLCTVVPIEKDWGNPDNNILVPIDDLDLHPVPLGYINCRGQAVYTMRIPMRRDWKQGLRQQNCWSSGPMLYQLPMSSLKNCIMNKYPTFERACKDVNVGVDRGRRKAIAWHRSWAVSTGGIVYYKNYEQVGSLNDGEVQLFKSFSYLKEALLESLS